MATALNSGDQKWFEQGLGDTQAGKRLFDVLNVTLGTQAASKVVANDSNSNQGIAKVTQLHVGTSGSETQVNATAAEINRAADVSARLVDLTAATLSLTEATHDGKVVTVNRAAGSTLTLPAATGSGALFKIVIGTTLTSGSLIIQVTGNDVMKGVIIGMSDDPATVKGWANASDSDTITLNRTTTGVGTAGEWFELVDIATDTWHVHGVITQSGTEATPFSAAV